MTRIASIMMTLRSEMHLALRHEIFDYSVLLVQDRNTVTSSDKHVLFNGVLHVHPRRL